MTTEYKEIQIKPTGETTPTVIEVVLEDVTEAPEADVPVETKDTAPEKEVKPQEKPQAEVKKERDSRAQKRIKQLLADKQAAQEALEQERQARIDLEKRMHTGIKEGKTGQKSSLEAQIVSLTRQLATAMQNGESDQVVALQDALIDAKMELKVLSLEMKDMDAAESVKPESRQPDRPNIPDAALAWIEEYPAFKTDAYFRNSTIVENNQLISEGYDPNTEEFYDELNTRLAPRFPKLFGVQAKTSVSFKDKESSSDSETDVEQDVKPSTSQKARTTEQVVSGSSRPSSHASSTSRKTTSVTLTPEHVKQAERWGISLEQMARRIAFSEDNKRVDGYVPIIMKNQ